MSRKLKIISDGTRQGTKLIDIESGEPVAGVLNLEWKLEDEEGTPPFAIIMIEAPAFEIEGYETDDIDKGGIFFD